MNTLQIEKNKDLRGLNTLGAPAMATHYARTDSVETTREALLWAKQHDLSVFVLGGGSNVILEPHIRGLVLQPLIMGKTFRKTTAGQVEVCAGAGENWHELVTDSVARGYGGLENLALIPGSVGAAPIQNIGAYGVELQQRFISLEALDRQSGECHQFDLESCQFTYRESIFKKRWRNRFIITSVSLRLFDDAACVTHYPALSKALAEQGIAQPSADDVMRTVMGIRRSKLPDPSILPNAGSFFKNPLVDQAQFDLLLTRFPDLPGYLTHDKRVKIPAGWLIEHCGWKGRAAFEVAVHKQHALVLTNPHRRDAHAILRLATAIQESVRERFTVTLELEPQRLGVH